MKRYLVGILILAMFGLMGCEHTIQGFGQDMQQNGKKIESTGN